MKTIDSIINQLKSQNIEYDLFRSTPDISDDIELKDSIKKWIDKFYSRQSKPDRDILWHTFSFKNTDCLDGDEAIKELKNQYDADTLIFNDSRQFLIRCRNKIPIIEIDDFKDDLYISHHNMKWTFVITHEMPDLGPYFSYGNK